MYKIFKPYGDTNKSKVGKEIFIFGAYYRVGKANLKIFKLNLVFILTIVSHITRGFCLLNY